MLVKSVIACIVVLALLRPAAAELFNCLGAGFALGCAASGSKGSTEEGTDCFCDQVCHDFADCCPDIADISCFSEDTATCVPKFPVRGCCVSANPIIDCIAYLDPDDRENSCYCDEACATFGDCCPDINLMGCDDDPSFGISCIGNPENPLNSTHAHCCEERCASSADICFCDELCYMYGDCCPDAYTYGCGRPVRLEEKEDKELAAILKLKPRGKPKPQNTSPLRSQLTSVGKPPHQRRGPKPHNRTVTIEKKRRIRPDHLK